MHHDMTGFGVRVYPSKAKVYVAQTRGPRGPKRVTVGRHGVISADQARRRAALIIARIKAGEAPIAAPMAPRTGPTVAALAERYLREHVAVRCKPSTERSCRRVIANHILPELGKLPLAAVEREHVTEMHYKLSGVPAMANRAVSNLSRMFNQAEAWGLAPEGGNPCRFVVKYKERKRERFLTEGEFRRLGRVLAKAAAEGGVSALAAVVIRLLMLTGCRINEILTLRWEDVALDGRVAFEGRQDGTTRGSAIACGGEDSHGPASRSGQSVGLSGEESVHPSDEYRRPVVSPEGARRAGGRAASRFAAFVCQPRAGARREFANDRKVTGAQPGRDDGALRASGTGFGTGIGGPDCRQYRSRSPVQLRNRFG